MNITDHVRESFFTFGEARFTSVDSLVLCQLFYAKIETAFRGIPDIYEDPGLCVKDFYRAEFFPTMFNDGITDKQNLEIFTVAAASRRYRDIRVRNLEVSYNNVDEKQFAAVAFEIDKDTDYVCFRGTDGTMLGWKEDFQMAFKSEIPSQLDALGYLEKNYGPGTKGAGKKLYVGGHSKGGNLAIFAAFTCSKSIQERIIKIYSHDGPGFRDDVVDKLRELGGPMEEKLVRQIPQSSIIGMLLHQNDEYCVIKSNAFGILQHAAFSWEIENGDFVELEHITKHSAYVNRTIHAWLLEASDEERETFVEGLFDLFSENDIRTVSDLRAITPARILRFIKSIDNMDEATKNAMDETIKALISSAFKEILPERSREE